MSLNVRHVTWKSTTETGKEKSGETGIWGQKHKEQGACGIESLGHRILSLHLLDLLLKTQISGGAAMAASSLPQL